MSKRFESIWEDKWTIKIAQSGEGLISEWSEELAMFNSEVLQEAATKARGRFTWPPSIAEFSEICREVKKGLAFPVIEEKKKYGSSDMTHAQWKSWIKIRFGFDAII